MNLAEMSLESLAHADGGSYDAHFKHLLRQAVKHCEDQPYLGKPRKVVVCFTLHPTVDRSSHTPRLESIRSDVDLKLVVPTTPLKALDMQVKSDSRKGAYAVINTDIPDDRNQYDIGDALKGKGKATGDAQ